MGLVASIERVGNEGDLTPANRRIFAEFDSFYTAMNSSFRTLVIYKMNLRYLRFHWSIYKRFNDFYRLDAQLRLSYPQRMATIPQPKKFSTFMHSHSDPGFCNKRGQFFYGYIQCIVDAFFEDILNGNCMPLLLFFDIGVVIKYFK